MIEKGAHVNLAVDNGRTALMLSAQHGYHKVADLLLKAKADMTLRNTFKETALMLACRFGQTDVAQRLLDEEGGGTLEAECKEGEWTSLHRACQAGHDKIVR